MTVVSAINNPFDERKKMVQFVCILSYYHTWCEDSDSPQAHNRQDITFRLEHAAIQKFLNGGIGLWEFCAGKIPEAYNSIGNNHGILEKVIAYIRVKDDSMDAKHRSLYYIMEDEGRLTYVIPQPHPVTAKDQAVAQYTKPLNLTAEHIRKTAPSIVDYIKSNEQKRARI